MEANYSIEYDHEKYIVTIYYASLTILWQRGCFWRDERNAVKRIARFIRDNG